jgi:Domain of unknown function (DUF397)
MRDDLTPAAWRKSTFSNPTGECVEVAELGTTRAVRDSKNPTGPMLRFITAEWSAFTSAIRTGQFD